MDESIDRLVGLLVADSAVTAFNAFLNQVEELVNKQDSSVEIYKLKKEDRIILVKLETENTSMALVNKEGRFAIDADTRDPDSGLIPINKDQYCQLTARAEIIEKKYSTYSTPVVANWEDTCAGNEDIKTATPEEEYDMLTTCVNVMNTLDGKEIHYKDLSQRSFGHVTIVQDGDEFVMALTCKHSSIFGSTSPESLPRKFSAAVSDAMRETFNLVNSKLPNKLPANMRLLLPLISDKFNNMSEEEKRKIIAEIRKRRH